MFWHDPTNPRLTSLGLAGRCFLPLTSRAAHRGGFEGYPPPVSSYLSAACPQPPRLGLLELSLPFQRMHGSLHWSRLPAARF